MRILIAEDETISRRKLQRQLARWGYEVDVAENGQQAWNIFQAGEYSLIVTDWIMPEMDGPTLVRRIRDSNPDRYVYIILLTAKTETEDVVAGMDAGADDFLSKPFDRHELRVRIQAGERVLNLEQTLADRNTELEEKNARMKRDLDAAARLQQSLLPMSMPDTDVAHFAWQAQPCDELGGDCLNVVQLDEQHVSLYVTDVSGHGVASSLLAVAINRLLIPTRSGSSLVRDNLDSSRVEVASPARVAAALNERFPMTETDKFFTMIYGVLNLTSLKFHYTSAGHPPVIHVTEDGTAHPLAATGLPVGILPDADFEDRVVQLQPRDRLYLYSDGIPEAAAPQDRDLFGDGRLRSALEQRYTDTLTASVEEVMTQVRTWCDHGPKDDITILGAEIQA